MQRIVLNIDKNVKILDFNEIIKILKKKILKRIFVKVSEKRKLKCIKKIIFFAFTISILTHIFVFYSLNVKNDKLIKEIIVLDLGTYQESYQPIAKKKNSKL